MGVTDRSRKPSVHAGFRLCYFQKRTGSVPLIYFRCFFSTFFENIYKPRDQQEEEPKQAPLCFCMPLEIIGDGFHFIRVEMGVRLHGDLHRITQTLGHGHDGITQLHQESSLGVPEVMNPDALHPGRAAIRSSSRFSVP